MQDHPACLVSYLLKEEAGPLAVTDELLHKNGSLRLRAKLNYALRRRGPLTTTGCDHGAFVDTKGLPALRLGGRHSCLLLRYDNHMGRTRHHEQARSWSIALVASLHLFGG